MPPLLRVQGNFIISWKLAMISNYQKKKTENPQTDQVTSETNEKERAQEIEQGNIDQHQDEANSIAFLEQLVKDIKDLKYFHIVAADEDLDKIYAVWNEGINPLRAISMKTSLEEVQQAWKTIEDAREEQEQEKSHRSMEKPSMKDKFLNKCSWNMLPKSENIVQTAFFCAVKEPKNSVAANCQKQILENMRSNNILIEERPNSKTILLTSLMSSRIETDIERDMKAASVSAGDTENTILLRIVTVRGPDAFIERKTKKKFLLDLQFLVDQFDNKLFKCLHNDQQTERLAKFMRKNAKY